MSRSANGVPPAPLAVICGPMFAGKTTELLRRVARARAEGRRVLVVKPARAHRYGSDAVVSHAGVRMPARPVAALDDLALGGPARDGPVDLLRTDAREPDRHELAARDPDRVGERGEAYRKRAADHRDAGPRAGGRTPMKPVRAMIARSLQCATMCHATSDFR